MPAHIAHSRIGDVKCGDSSAVNEHVWVANELAALLAKKGASLVAQSPFLIGDLAGKAKLTTQVVVCIGQITPEANQHKTHEGRNPHWRAKA